MARCGRHNLAAYQCLIGGKRGQISSGSTNKQGLAAKRSSMDQHLHDFEPARSAESARSATVIHQASLPSFVLLFSVLAKQRAIADSCLSILLLAQNFRLRARVCKLCCRRCRRRSSCRRATFSPPFAFRLLLLSFCARPLTRPDAIGVALNNRAPFWRPSRLAKVEQVEV